MRFNTILLLSFITTAKGQFCPDGSQAISTCVNGACQPNFACTGANICCSLASVSGQFCPTGGSPTSNCVNGVCPAGYYCAGVLCCPGGQLSQCPNGGIFSQTCVNGQCPLGSTCYGTQCCTNTMPTCPNGAAFIQSCINGQCPANSICLGNICCTNTNSIATCLNGGTIVQSCVNGPCPFNSVCLGNVCCTINTCPTDGLPISQCVNGLCPSGYSCVTGNVCCFQPNQNCPGGQISGGSCGINGACPFGYQCNFALGNLCCLNSVVLPYNPSFQGCPNGGTAVAACINGQCLSGPTTGNFICFNNFCCTAGSYIGAASCPFPVGSCMNGQMCSIGYSCVSGVCCPQTGQRCPSGVLPGALCINNVCGYGYTCTNGRYCCPPAGVIGRKKREEKRHLETDEYYAH